MRARLLRVFSGSNGAGRNRIRVGDRNRGDRTGRAEAEALVQAASDARDQALAAREAQHLKAADQRAATAEARAEAARADAERELGRLR